jgi:hypothetical protein
MPGNLICVIRAIRGQIKSMGKIALAIHGGAGTILRSQMTAELDAEYRAGLDAALRAGWSVLEGGGSALDSAEAAVASLEDFPLFNAGRGSVFTAEGRNEMDAAVMDGSRLRAGAVAFVRNVRNPIRLARLVMERTEHVLLAGDGANQFAAEAGVEMADDEYFFTQHRWDQLQEAIAAGRVQLDHAAEPAAAAEDLPADPIQNPKSKIPWHGRCGCVRCRRAPSRGDLDRRDDEQALWARGRFAANRRRDLCRRPLRGVVHRPRRILYHRRDGV